MYKENVETLLKNFVVKNNFFNGPLCVSTSTWYIGTVTLDFYATVVVLA